jgi:uncharacterized protein (DUF305 family)
MTLYFRTALIPLILVGACSTIEKTPPPADDPHAHHMAGLPAASEIVIPEGSYYNVADVHFMQGMIAHHGQAVLMASLAGKNGANPRLLQFTQKIALSQSAEIQLMQGWLDERGQFVPDTASYKTVTMPGMLTAEQLKQLESAKGKDFDRMFLEMMIQHHEGALQMVADLQATPLAMQDPLLSSFTTDIDTDQRAEILKMHQMLDEIR